MKSLGKDRIHQSVAVCGVVVPVAAIYSAGAVGWLSLQVTIKTNLLAGAYVFTCRRT